MSHPTPDPPRRAAAGVVLAGGASRRMGTDKALLSWDDATVLDHVLGVLARAVTGPLVVVGPAGFPRPVGGPRTLSVSDEASGRGPLQGIATGLTAAASAGASTAFLCSVDLPLLHEHYVTAVLGFLDGPDDGVDDGPGSPPEVALPVVHGHRQPLAAAYVTALGARAHALLAAGSRRPPDLFAVSRVREVDADALLADPALRAVDPGLDAVRDADTPADLAALRRLAARRAAPE